MAANQIKNKYSAISQNLNYWKTKDGAKVDFILGYGNKMIPIEVKYRQLKKTTVGKSLYNVISKYSPQRAYLINLTLNDKIENDMATRSNFEFSCERKNLIKDPNINKRLQLGISKLREKMLLNESIERIIRENLNLIK